MNITANVSHTSNKSLNDKCSDYIVDTISLFKIKNRFAILKNRDACDPDSMKSKSRIIIPHFCPITLRRYAFESKRAHQNHIKKYHLQRRNKRQ